jgi:excisionase family DNA binding protein
LPKGYNYPMIVDENEVYTPEEIRSILKISDSTFRRLIRNGVLRAGKIGGQYRVLGKHILQLLSPSLPGKVKGAYKKVIKELEK